MVGGGKKQRETVREGETERQRVGGREESYREREEREVPAIEAAGGEEMCGDGTVKMGTVHWCRRRCWNTI